MDQAARYAVRANEAQQAAINTRLAATRQQRSVPLRKAAKERARRQRKQRQADEWLEAQAWPTMPLPPPPEGWQDRTLERRLHARGAAFLKHFEVVPGQGRRNPFA